MALTVSIQRREVPPLDAFLTGIGDEELARARGNEGVAGSQGDGLDDFGGVDIEDGELARVAQGKQEVPSAAARHDIADLALKLPHEGRFRLAAGSLASARRRGWRRSAAEWTYPRRGGRPLMLSTPPSLIGPSSPAGLAGDSGAGETARRGVIVLGLTREATAGLS